MLPVACVDMRFGSRLSLTSRYLPRLSSRGLERTPLSMEVSSLLMLRQRS